MTIQNAYLTQNRPGNIRTRTTAIAIHWVGNAGTSAMANRNYFNSTDKSVSSNYIVGLNGEVICCIPHREESWCTNQANPYTVSIETCHPDWTGEFNSKTYASLVELTAELCKTYNLDPNKGGVIRHYDVTKKVCPKWFVSASAGGSDTNDEQHWKKFKDDVASKMGKKTSASSTSSSSTSKTTITVEEAARGVIAGKYGNGEDRKKRIASLGLDYNAVQTRVNQILGTKTSASTSSTKTTVSSKVAAAKSKSDAIRGTYTVTASSLYCRYIPGKLSDDNVVTAFKNGTSVVCYGYYTTVGNSKWYLVQSGKYTGYCNSKYLKKK